jgi:hypothetical protein
VGRRDGWINVTCPDHYDKVTGMLNASGDLRMQEGTLESNKKSTVVLAVVLVAILALLIIVALLTM